MSVLRRTLNQLVSSGMVTKGPPSDILQELSSYTHQAAAIQVVKIENGFLITRREHNPNGPDPVRATFVADPKDLGTAILAEFTYRTITK